MTAIDQATKALGFRWLKQLRDPEFRQYLREIGHEGGAFPVVPCFADDEIGAVLDRCGHEERALIAVADANGQHGWRLVWVEGATT